MSKLTDGSENECADAELSIRDPFSDDEEYQSDDFVAKDSKLKRSLADGCNLNNSFGEYDAEEWGNQHRDKGANPQFLLQKK